jgi:hypothetical protein
MRVLYLHHPAPLTELAEACLALSPRIAAFPHALFIDLEATEKAWKGEVRQTAALWNLLERFEIYPQVVIADRAAWAPAFAIGDGVLLPRGESVQRLWQLPIERLAHLGSPKEAEEEARERAQLVTFMRRVGLQTIGDFLKLRPEAVTRRFGKIGASLLDWATGTKDIVLPTFAPEEPLQDLFETEEISSLEQLLFVARKRWRRLEARLSGRGLLAQEVRMDFQFDSDPPVSRSLRLAEPLRETSAFVRLLQDFLSGMQWDSPLTRLGIHITRTTPARAGQLSLFDDEVTQFADLGQYVSRLRARYGEASVGFTALKSSHLPESSFEVSWPPSHPGLPKTFFPERPLFVFDPPRPYAPSRRGSWRQTECLAAEWWRGEGDRHYFIHHTPEGSRLWVYWDTLQKQWFLHGTFD